MQIYDNIGQIKFNHQRAVTIGCFDGVHLGHRKILETLQQHADKQALTTLAIIFAKPPKNFFLNVEQLLLSPINERISMLKRYKIDELLILHFDEKLSKISPYSFIVDYILKYIGAKLFVVGKNHTFGLNGAGNLFFLQQLSKECRFCNLQNFDVIGVDFAKIEDSVVSSTLIRNNLKTKKIEAINKYLGYEYRISGIVEHGKQLGRTLGFPTANLSVPQDKLLPKNGVYLCRVNLLNGTFIGVVNVGVKPTIECSKLMNISTVEVHILDFNSEIYGHFVVLELQQFVREEMKFDNLQKLVEQIKQDIALAKNML